jgi:uncharacterized protein (TIGR03083 family)
VRDLVAHVGTGHRWAAGIVEQRLQSPVRSVKADPPAEPTEWADWLADGARRLADAVHACGPREPVWTWQADKTAGFWLRRMLHDELVHRYDAEIAARRLGDVAPDLAADGVSDLLDCFVALSAPGSRDPIFGGLAGSGQTMRLAATDSGLGAAGEWFIDRTPDGVRWRSGSPPDSADVTVRAPARELLLVLNRRLEPDQAGVEVDGDREMFLHWLANSRF